MSWLSRVRNGIQGLTKRQHADNLWHKCTKCAAMVFTKEWEDNVYVCPRCDHHDRIGPKAKPLIARLKAMGGGTTPLSRSQ